MPLTPLLGIAFFALTLLTFGLTIEQYFKPLPVFFTADDLTLRSLPQMLSRGASVFLTNRAEVQKIPMALAAYALRDFPLYGKMETGYGDLNNREAGEVYDYALLARGEDPATRGYAPAPLWSNREFVLYRRAPGVALHNDLNTPVRPGQSVTLTVGAQGVIAGAQAVPGDQAVRRVRVALVALTAQSVKLTVNGQERTVSLPPGLSVYELPQASLPATLLIGQDSSTGNGTLPADSPVTLFVVWVEQGEPASGEPAVIPTDSLLLRCAAGPAETLDADCLVANPTGATLRWESIIRGTPKGATDEQVLMQRSADGSPRQKVTLTLTRHEGLTTMQFDGQVATLTGATRSLGDGKYRVSLEVYRGEVLLAQLELYSVTISQGGASWQRSGGGPLPLIIAKP